MPNVRPPRAAIQRSDLHPDHVTLYCLPRTFVLALAAYAHAYAMNRHDLRGQAAAANCEQLMRLLGQVPAPDPDADDTLFHYLTT